jgi:hypothetical protein
MQNEAHWLWVKLMRSSSATNNHRRGNRTKAVLPVRIKGKDSTGNTFEELAITLDVTMTGIRLGSVRHDLNNGEEISVFYRQRKMQFRVMWTKKLKGTSEFQVGLQALTQDRESWVLGFAEFRSEFAPVAISQASGVA